MSHKKKGSIFDTRNINIANTQHVIVGEMQVNSEQKNK